MGDSCTALEFPVAELAGKPGAVYVIRFRGQLSDAIHERVQRYWRQAFERAGRWPPSLIILDSDLTDLMPLDEELRPVGLLRVEAGQ